MPDFKSPGLRPLFDGDALFPDGLPPYSLVEFALEPSYGPRSAKMKAQVASFVEDLLIRRRTASIATARRFLESEAMAGRMAYKLPPPRLFASWAQTADHRVRRRKPVRRYNW